MIEAGEFPGAMDAPALCADVPEGFRSGFVALVGRPNAGKSTLLNACCGEKVAITSPVAQTTRRRLRAVVNREDCQLVIVDTPGIHKPKDGLGSELNKSALGELSDVDVIAFVIDASAPSAVVTPGLPSACPPPRRPRSWCSPRPDLASPEEMLKQLEAARALQVRRRDRPLPPRASTSRRSWTWLPPSAARSALVPRGHGHRRGR